MTKMAKVKLHQLKKNTTNCKQAKRKHLECSVFSNKDIKKSKYYQNIHTNIPPFFARTKNLPIEMHFATLCLSFNSIRVQKSFFFKFSAHLLGGYVLFLFGFPQKKMFQICHLEQLRNNCHWEMLLHPKYFIKLLSSKLSILDLFFIKKITHFSLNRGSCLRFIGDVNPAQFFLHSCLMKQAVQKTY